MPIASRRCYSSSTVTIAAVHASQTSSYGNLVGSQTLRLL